MNNSNYDKNDIIRVMNKKKQIGYDINKKDIDSTIRFLEINDPENATPERAIDFLVYTKSNLRDGAQIDLGASLLDLYEEFKKSL